MWMPKDWNSREIYLSSWGLKFFKISPAFCMNQLYQGGCLEREYFLLTKRKMSVYNGSCYVSC